MFYVTSKLFPAKETVLEEPILDDRDVPAEDSSVEKKGDNFDTYTA